MLADAPEEGKAVSVAIDNLPIVYSHIGVPIATAFLQRQGTPGGCFLTYARTTFFAAARNLRKRREIANIGDDGRLD
jgi:hypothetical protein